MKRNLIIISTCLCMAWLFGASLGAANEKTEKAASVAGTWDCQSKGGSEGDLDFTLYLEQTGEDISGTVSSPMGDASITSGTFKGKHLEIHIDTEAGNYLLEATLDNAGLSGTWSKDQDKGTWVGKLSGSK